MSHDASPRRSEYRSTISLRVKAPGSHVGPTKDADNCSVSEASTQYPRVVPRSMSGSPIVAISQSKTVETRVVQLGSKATLSNLKSLWISDALLSVGMRAANHSAAESISGI